jgi:hypothetical protein
MSRIGSAQSLGELRGGRQRRSLCSPILCASTPGPGEFRVGKGVLVMSLETEELTGLCERILEAALHAGHLENTAEEGGLGG